MKNMHFKRKLPVPKEIKEQYPLTQELSQIKLARDVEIEKVFTGQSNKLVLVIGPCSADREDAVLDYCERLAKLQDAVSDKLILIFPGFTQTSPEPLEKATRDFCISLIRSRHPICWKASSPFAVCIPTFWQIPGFPPRMKCCIRIITVTCPTFWPMLLLAHGVWKIRNTA